MGQKKTTSSIYESKAHILIGNEIGYSQQMRKLNGFYNYALFKSVQVQRVNKMEISKRTYVPEN